MTTLKKKVAVLMGGWSAEREVSLESGRLVGRGLEESGYDVTYIDLTRDLNKLMADLTPKPDVVFNALHGPGGEDGIVQGVLEVMGIPYTHSGVCASALAMDKVLSRKVFEREGIQTPVWKIVTRQEIEKGHPMSMPYVIKPINEGSSVGIYMIHTEDDFKTFQKEWTYGDTILIEKYVPGREVQVGVVGDRAVGAIELRTNEPFYNYVAKYTPGATEHLMPAPIPPAAYKKVLELGLQAHQALGCRSVSRSDFMYDEAQDQFYLLELNTQPGMSPISLLPEIAAHDGMPFNQLISWMVEEAQCDL